MKSFLAGCLTLTLSLLPDAAHAEVEKRRVEWRPEWHEVAGWEVATSVVLGASIVGIIVFTHEDDPLWREPFIGDDPVRDLVRARSPEGRRRAQIIGDVTYYGSLAYPVLA